MSGVASNFNLSLIEEYKKCPALYDCDNPDYKVHLPTKECWQKIADICGVGAHDCRVRWKALRDRYIKERKRLGISGTAEDLDKRWPLYTKMNFLEPYVEKQKSASRVTLVPVSGIGSSGSMRKDDADEDQGVEQNSEADKDNHPNSKGEVSLPTFNAVTVAEDALKSEDAFCHRLISEVKEHKLIYDHTDPSYRVATVRTQTWETIAEKLGDSSYSSGKDLRKKWRSLRDKFIRERRLIRESLEAGQPKTSNWSLFEELSFLEPYLDTNPATHADESEVADHAQQLGAAAAGMQQAVLDALAKNAAAGGAGPSLELLTASLCSSLDGQAGSQQQSPDDSGAKSELLDSADERSGANNRKRKFRVEQGEELSLHREILRCVRAGAENLSRLCQAITDENEDMLFARYIATLLQNMTPERRAQMKLQIFATLHSIPESSLTHM